MSHLINNFLHYLAQLSLTIIPIYFAWWLEHHKR